MINVLIADDHQMFIEGIKALLTGEADITVVGEANDGAQVLQQLASHEVHVVLLDINMPGMDGLEATKLIAKQYPQVKILVLTMYNKRSHITNIMEAGAHGYILKNTGKAELLEGIRKIAAGQNYYSPSVTKTIMDGLGSAGYKHVNGPVKLTKREIEILKLIAQEYTNQEIAKKLFISTYTVETHRKNLMSKLGVKNSVGLVVYAMSEGLVDDVRDY